MYRFRLHGIALECLSSDKCDFRWYKPNLKAQIYFLAKRGSRSTHDKDVKTL